MAEWNGVEEDGLKRVSIQDLSLDATPDHLIQQHLIPRVMVHRTKRGIKAE